MTDDMWGEQQMPVTADSLAEESVLGACLLEPSLLDEITLAPGDFSDARNAQVWEALQDLHGEGVRPDATAVAVRLADWGKLAFVGGGPRLHDLAEVVPVAASGPYYASLVAESARRRAVAAFADSAGAVSRSSLTSTEMVERLRHRLEVIEGSAESGDGPKPWAQVIEQGMEAIDRAASGEEDRGVPTGLIDLDKVVGGFKPGDVTLVAGRPGSGKSVLAAQTAAHVALDLELPVLFMSLEMRIPEIYNRIAASRLGINLGNFTSGVISDNEASKLARQAGMSAASPLWVDDTPSHTLASIGAIARRFKRQHGLRLLVLDYLQLIEPPKAENRQVAVSMLSRGLKLLAAQLEIPIMVAAQLNRGPENRGGKVPTLADLRESGSLEQDASVVILVHREAASDPKSVRQGEADLIVAKNRNGAQATVQVAAQLHYARFASMAGTDRH